VLDLVTQLKSHPDCAVAAPCSPEALEEALRRLPRLPEPHQQVLSRANGLVGFGGYYRLFGACVGELPDLRSWNAADTWKFAWEGRAEPYFCFGETAWGDQYAYQIRELEGDTAPQVYFLESITMAAEPIAASFSEFCHAEFLRSVLAPYDEMVVAVRARLGDLSPTEHVVYQPSLLLGGAELPENVQRMLGVAAMIANGDLCTQLSGELESRCVREIQAIPDAKGRMRLRVVWADGNDS